MKYFYLIVAFFLSYPVQAHTLTVSHVKVSVKADSAASAQAQALDQAHQLAFQKLVAEHFPDHAGPLPSKEVLQDMVTDFSIDREKTTPLSYTASLTFQFNEPSVLAWLHRGQQATRSSPLSYQSYNNKDVLNMTVSYATHEEWQQSRKTLETFPGVQTFSILALTAKNARIKLSYRGSMDQLKQGLLQKGLLLTQQDDEWKVSSRELFLR